MPLKNRNIAVKVSPDHNPQSTVLSPSSPPQGNHYYQYKLFSGHTYTQVSLRCMYSIIVCVIFFIVRFNQYKRYPLISLPAFFHLIQLKWLTDLFLLVHIILPHFFKLM